jgi:hypothetical protein
MTETQIIAPAPQIVAPINAPALTPEEAAKGRDTVTMIFDKKEPVTLTVQHGLKVRYTQGIHQVPREWSDHWYLKVHGARIYSQPVAVPSAPAEKASKKK